MSDDVRHRYIRELQRVAASLTRHEYHHRSFVATCRAVAHMALEERPIRSATDARRNVHTLGQTIEQQLVEMDGLGTSARPPTAGTFSSAAACILVALHQWRQDGADGFGAEKHCPQALLLRRARALLEQPASAAFLDDALLLQKRLCPMWQQAVSLETMGFVKPRNDKRSCDKVGDMSGRVWELTAAGRAKAEALIANGEARPAGATRQHRPDAPLLLLVDAREGGGMTCGAFNSLCAQLERDDVAFETAQLPRGLGDYLFVSQPGNLIGSARHALPLVVERKSLVDVAGSLRDGRWGAQQAAMIGTKERMACALGARETVRLVYLIEGSRPIRAFACGCGCGARGVGGCERTHASVSDVEDALAGLVADGFEVEQTGSFAQSAAWLAATAAELAAALRDGDVHACAAFELPAHIATRRTEAARGRARGDGACAPALGADEAAAHVRSAESTPRGARARASKVRRLDDAAVTPARSPTASVAPSLTPSPSPTGAAHANAGAARRAKAVAMPLAELGAQLAELISANELELEGAMPTATQLDAAGRRDLNTAIAKHGGVGAVCRSLGLRDKKPYWPRDRTCNFALLVAAHASWRRAGGRDGLAGRELDAALRESALTKEELMAAANPIAEVDIHEVHNDYNGWAGVTKELVRPNPPRQPWLRKCSKHVTGRGDKEAFVLTDYGRARAELLHAHAEHHGWCTCALVQPRALVLLSRTDGARVNGAGAKRSAHGEPAPPPHAAAAAAASPPASSAARAAAAEQPRARPPLGKRPARESIVNLVDETDTTDDPPRHREAELRGAPAARARGAEPEPPPLTACAAPTARAPAAAPPPAAPSTAPIEIDLTDDGEESAAALGCDIDLSGSACDGSGDEAGARERIAPPVRRADRAPTRGKVLLGWDEWRGAVFYEIEWRVRHVAGGPWGAWTGSDGARRLTVAHCQKALPAGADGALPSAVMFRVRPLARTGEPLARFSDGSQPFDVPR
ncbi:hypothetical protein KFE25_009334 [Diacronema lutheri]|uniref:Crossover junction endonuclease MUS81 n=1 Tax=Diacronema lutheri TaxID=2081491 RepID=A0A8J5XMH8_DIALT|nr:hypothetical protein KFE25_009334 [Diacronema lutheri]